MERLLRVVAGHVLYAVDPRQATAGSGKLSLSLCH